MSDERVLTDRERQVLFGVLAGTRRRAAELKDEELVEIIRGLEFKLELEHGPAT